MNRRSSLGAAVAVALAATAMAQAVTPAVGAGSAHNGLPHGTKTQKSLVIGIDGAMLSKFSTANMPNIQGLRSQGLSAPSRLYANPLAPTFSGPGWATIATGAWPDKHGVKDNSFSGSKFGQYPDYQTRLESANPAVSTLVVGTWSNIVGNVFAGTADVKKTGANDDETTNTAVDYLRNGNPDSAFVHLDDVDHAGHDHGAASAEYKDALEAADTRVGKLLTAIAARPTYANEDWQILVTADHGHTESGGHGGNSLAERETFVIAKGSDYTAGSVRHDLKLVDIAPTVLAHAGVSVPSGLDGKPVPDVSPDAFDTLRPSLKAAVDETSVPSGVKGWTTTAPSGWSIDNAKMPTGGVTEWRGWSFATDEFWTQTDRGQGRETNVRARNVFAVADSDEWDDKSHGTGQFDSTLKSPAYYTPDDRTMQIRYTTNYTVDGPQTGDVLVSFDGGTPQVIKSYRDTNVNKQEQVNFDVPAGAETVRVHFRYTGTNSAFWTIDDFRIYG
ncbi:alkaline phosphatase family protein [Streptomyces rubiginosohelvolus]|uniref:alkaline phosphatase family protein n=1 Tax=Streptomyces rubiginosohelvolus TaxID=67362 RepID=UPI003720A04B